MGQTNKDIYKLAEDIIRLSKKLSSGPWDGGINPKDPNVRSSEKIVAAINNESGEYNMFDAIFIAKARTLLPLFAEEILKNKKETNS